MAMRDNEYLTSRGRRFSFDGWPDGGRPTELFDLGQWAACLHACMFAASRRANVADIEDDGPLHELIHLICGIPVCTHGSMDDLRRQIYELEMSADAGQIQHQLSESKCKTQQHA